MPLRTSAVACMQKSLLFQNREALSILVIRNCHWPMLGPKLSLNTVWESVNCRSQSILGNMPTTNL